MSQYSARGRAWLKIRDAVLQRDGGICYYCQGIATTADHLTPRSLILKQGGTPVEADAMSNLVAACAPCNRRKKDKLIVSKPYRNSRYY